MAADPADGGAPETDDGAPVWLPGECWLHRARLPEGPGDWVSTRCAHHGARRYVHECRTPGWPGDPVHGPAQKIAYVHVHGDPLADDTRYTVETYRIVGPAEETAAARDALFARLVDKLLAGEPPTPADGDGLP